MKRVSIILLICIYSLSTFGISLKQFYCCGTLKSVTVTLATAATDKCSNGSMGEGCCKTKYQYFKVKDSHFANAEVTAPVKYFTDLVSYYPLYQNLTYLPQLVDVINAPHAPPLYAGVPIYISDCVFRI